MNARELLIDCLDHFIDCKDVGVFGLDNIIVKIKTELAKPETKSEQFGYVFEYKPGKYLDMFSASTHRIESIEEDYGAKAVKVYTEPPKRKPVLLSNNNLFNIFAGWEVLPVSTREELADVARAIEQAVLKANGIGVDNAK